MWRRRSRAATVRQHHPCVENERACVYRTAEVLLTAVLGSKSIAQHPSLMRAIGSNRDYMILRDAEASHLPDLRPPIANSKRHLTLVRACPNEA